MDDRIFKTLSRASQDVMMDKVESLVIMYITKDGDMHSAYDKNDDASVLNMVGGIEALKTRVILGYDIIPELSDDDED